MKSGTTSLFATLARHPKIAPAHPKEPGYFAFDDVNAQGLDWYDSLFDFDPDSQAYRLDGSTDYTKAPFVTGVRERMAAVPGARFKLIYIMRHPLRRIESHARDVQRTRKEIGQYNSKHADHSLDTSVSLQSLAMARYAEQLDVFADLFDAGDIFVTGLEDLKAEPAETLERLYRFLDLDFERKATDITRKNVAKDRVSLSSSWSALTSNPFLLKVGKLFLSEALQKKIKSRFRRRVVVEGRFDLTPEEEATLLSLLNDDLHRLQTRFGFDVERVWGIPVSMS